MLPRSMHDLAGIPRSEHMSVSDFMHMLESDIERPSVYAGELYLELHRGTLTNQHEIKRGNRLCEIALHNLELAVVMDAVKRGAVADGADVAPLMNELLVRQFHDILPGTCIHSVHEETCRAIADTIAKAHEMTDKLLPGDGAANEVTLINPLSFERSDVLLSLIHI